QVVVIAGLGLLIPWGAFVMYLVGNGLAKTRPGARLALGCGALVLAAAACAVAGLPAFQISDIAGPFYAARFDTVGRYAVVAQLLGTAVILAGLEVYLRTTQQLERWRIKYLVLGLGGIFLVRFYFLSQILLFHVLLAAYVTT